MIAVENLSFAYGSKTVLNEVTFSIQRGQIVGLVGPNGAGKTTLVCLLLGLRKPATGHVNVGDLDPVRYPLEVKKRVGVVHQNRQFDWELSVYDNLAIYAALHGLVGQPKRVAIAHLLEEFELNDHIERPIRTLSGGEQRRVQIARALVHRPEVLLLDEPATSLDSRWRLRVLEMIRTRARETGMTVLWTSHDMREIEEVADRVLLLNGGRIVANDAPDVLARRLTGERIYVRISGEVPQLTLPGLIGVYQEEEWLVFHVDAAEKCLPRILLALYQAGCQVDAVRTERASLEKAILLFNRGMVRLDGC